MVLDGGNLRQGKGQDGLGNGCVGFHFPKIPLNLKCRQGSAHLLRGLQVTLIMVQAGAGGDHSNPELTREARVTGSG